ncbi:MAG: hypothetical protein Q4E16_04600 [Neisseria sp.]|nr:hypothetical protein [Neisseria sp.]
MNNLNNRLIDIFEYLISNQTHTAPNGAPLKGMAGKSGIEQILQNALCIGGDTFTGTHSHNGLNNEPKEHITGKGLPYLADKYRAALRKMKILEAQNKELEKSRASSRLIAGLQAYLLANGTHENTRAFMAGIPCLKCRRHTRQAKTQNCLIFQAYHTPKSKTA